MKKFLVNFRSEGIPGCKGTFKYAQKENTRTGKEIGGFDDVFEYSINEIDHEFKQKNKHLFKFKRGAGYWVWKPYIILNALNQVNNDDVIFYCDSGSSFIKPVDSLVNLIHDTDGVMVFRLGNESYSKESNQTKRDAFILTGCEGEKYTDTYSRISGFNIWKKNDFSITVIKEWLYYNQIPNCVTDSPSILGDNFPGFREHRHDQSILSLVSKKYNIKSYPTPCQFWSGGVITNKLNLEQSYFERPYGNVIDNHRNKD